MNREERFYSALRDVFVGAKIEGESGYINLMRIKSRYYTEGVFPRLQRDIDEALKPFHDFREELFDRLYDFFHRYFSESGSIYFRYTPLHQNVYEKVYTDDKDVMLFWKTHMLYYVKTDRLFNSMEVEVDGRRFFFDVSALEHKRANEKRDIVYAFKEKRQDGTLVFSVAYSEKGRKTKTDDILKVLRKDGDRIAEDTLDRAFRVFEKQSEVDYFINKDARAFLEEQFNLWMYQYMFSGTSEWTEARIKQLQTLKGIAFQIIAFISQFEDELVKIWNKPKFVLHSNYVITLDRIAEKEGGMAVVEALLAHPNWSAQVEEWRQLGIVDESFEQADVLEEELMGKRLSKRHEHLPIDTRHFKDLELEILGLFDDLDESLDGWLIKSENYQALNTILPKFRERVQCIFIDPPYNTGNDEFIYGDRFQHSSWLSLMQNRSELARGCLSEQGALFLTINDVEAHRLRSLLESVFGGDNFIANVVWQKKQSPQSDTINLSDMHDNILVYARRSKSSRNDPGGWERNLLPRGEDQESRYSNPDNDPRGDWSSGDATCNKTSEERPNLYYGVLNPHTKETVWPSKRRVWRFEKPLFDRLIKENRVWWGENGDNFPRLKRFRAQVAVGVVPSTWWNRKEVGDNQEARRELRRLFPEEEDLYITPKPTRLIQRILQIATDDRSLVMDFFAGSGSTAHAVISHNRTNGGGRRYLLVEMADLFETTLLPRIKKILFSDHWHNGRATSSEGGVGHFLKYYHLEQYEDALRRARYEEADLFDDPNQDPYHQYVFLRDLKMLEALEVDTRQNTVQVDLSKLYKGIDLAETLSNLTGKWIKRIMADSVEFEDGEVVDTQNLDWRRIKPLIWW